MSDCHDCGSCAVATAPAPARQTAPPHVVAIIGPPNSGKSTLFNRLTGLRQKVANFPGVTVEQRVGKAKMTFIWVKGCVAVCAIAVIGSNGHIFNF